MLVAERPDLPQEAGRLDADAGRSLDQGLDDHGSDLPCVQLERAAQL